jgi:hypothetical protein
MTVAVVALTLVLGAVGLAQAGASIGRLTVVQYSGGEGLFVAFLYVATTDKTIESQGVQVRDEGESGQHGRRRDRGCGRGS